ncbi:MAG TPA: 30S ribosomal protein S18 [bacterium]|nr:30S ribosomal protein S18 [bacterium]
MREATSPRGEFRERPSREERAKFVRKKKCRFCVEKATEIDYKQVMILRKFVTERGKIIPRRITGTCAYHQRYLTNAIKIARNIALMPYLAQ